jgi:digeranylgeranylglycerophospholipid reductase
MPIRATKRGVQRTPLDADADVVVCGASFAGLTVARELAGRPSRPRVLMVDRYEVGERQTSACAAPTEWLEHLGLAASIQQTFGDLVVHARDRTFRWDLPFTFSTFDYRRLCQLLLDGCDARFETAKVDGRTGDVVHTDRGDLRAPLIVDALGWRRVLDDDERIQPPEARLSRGLEIHPHAAGPDLELWLDPRYVRAGYSWSFPADAELRVGVGSFDPRDHVREPTERLAAAVGVPAERWQGNWIPHQIRPATADGIFFVGDSAGHCLPTTAEGIRPAFHFALALGRELRAVLAGERTREQALERYAAFSDAHRWKYDALLRTQDAVGRLNPRPRAMRQALTALSQPSLLTWMFRHYLNICPPEAAAAAAAAHGGYGRAVSAAAA